MKQLLFIHGWSVTNTDTYGALPARLAAETGVTVQHLHLGKYISFHDEVRVQDIACALEAAIKREIHLEFGERFAVITHSTGGPVVRAWWDHFYSENDRECPMSHVIHLAAAQFGSALAKLGKARISRIKGIFQGVEPGEKVLDWLELGSPEAWTLNQRWVNKRGVTSGDAPVFSFSLVGQQIDRKFYDNLNSYTGEIGSDGVVRAAASNLNTTAVRLEQRMPTSNQLKKGIASALSMNHSSVIESERVPFRLVPGTSHSGKDMGIMRSVKKTGPVAEVVKLVTRCLDVDTEANYRTLADRFVTENEKLVKTERLEIEDHFLLRDRYFFHDPCSMVIVRVTDDHGYTPQDLRILFTGKGGLQGDPNKLPEGFVMDSQRNSLHPGTITFFLNHEIIHGCEAVKRGSKTYRQKISGITDLGMTVEAFPNEGFAHYHPAFVKPNPEILRSVIKPHSTVMIDVVLKRIVHRNTMAITKNLAPASFKSTKPGAAL